MKKIFVVYLDNILIWIWTWEEYVRAVLWTLKVLAEYKLFLYLEKYEFEQKKIEYLGLVISNTYKNYEA